MRTVVSLLALFSSLMASVRSQPHPLTNLPPAGLVTTGYFFPGLPGKQKTASPGKTTTVVLGFHNDGKEAYNVSAIMGSLNSPTDFSIFVQNFTQQTYFEAVLPGKESSFEYKFMPDPRVEPRDFIVALTVIYQDTKGVYYSNTFFNQTIEIIEVKKLVDWELLFLYVFIFGLIAGIGYLIYSSVAPHLQSLGYISKKSKTKKVAAGPKVQTEEEAEDWLKGTNYAAFTQAKDAKKKVVPKEPRPAVIEEKKKPAAEEKKKAGKGK